MHNITSPPAETARTGREGNVIVSTPEGSERPIDQDAEQAGTQQQPTEKPVPDDSAKAKAKEMAKAYEDRPTAVLPGSDRTVTGTAVNEWLDEDGKPKYGQSDDAESSS